MATYNAKAAKAQKEAEIASRIAKQIEIATNYCMENASKIREYAEDANIDTKGFFEFLVAQKFNMPFNQFTLNSLKISFLAKQEEYVPMNIEVINDRDAKRIAYAKANGLYEKFSAIL